MIELKGFQFQLAKRRSKAFDFERASVAQMALHKLKLTIAAPVTMISRGFDPVLFRGEINVRHGANRHG